MCGMLLLLSCLFVSTGKICDLYVCFMAKYDGYAIPEVSYTEEYNVTKCLKLSTRKNCPFPCTQYQTFSKQQNYATYVKINFPPEDDHFRTEGCRVGMDPFIQQALTLI